MLENSLVFRLLFYMKRKKKKEKKRCAVGNRQTFLPNVNASENETERKCVYVRAWMCVCVCERTRERERMCKCERENIKKKVAEDPHLRLYLVGLLTTTVIIITAIIT